MGVKISAMTTAALPLDGSEMLELAVPGTPNLTRKATVIDMADYVMSLLPWIDVVRDHGADPTFATDSTAAIQAAIDAAEALVGAVLFFRRGRYKVAGALADTSRSNAQLLLPRRDYVDTEQITIMMIGEVAPPPIMSVLGTTPVPEDHVILEGTLNTASGTAPAMLGAHGPSGTFQDFTNVHLVVRNMAFRLPSNPQLTAVNLSKVGSVDLDQVVVDCGSYYVQGLTEPTTATSYGLRCPSNGNGANTVLGTVNVIGYHKGYQFGEHTNGRNVNAWGCKSAAEFVAADHASTFVRFMAVHCEKVLTATGAHYVDIHQLNIEHATSGWWVTDQDLDDTNNYLIGSLRWHVVLAGTGVDNTFTVVGGKRMRRVRIGAERVLTLSDAATINTDCNLADSFRVASMAGNRTIADPTNAQDGVVYNWRLKADGTAGRTPSFGSKFKNAPSAALAANETLFVSAQYDATDDTFVCGHVSFT